MRLRYELNVVPAPLVPRLLVRTFGLIKNALHWRRGAVLRYGPATAKVWATQDERWVYATISGSQEARDDLTMMLRETLRALFAEYKNLSVVEQMEWNGRWVPRATLQEMVKFQQRYQMRHRKSRDEDARWGFNSGKLQFLSALAPSLTASFALRPGDRSESS